MKNPCPGRDLTELSTGSVRRWQEAPRLVPGERIAQRNEASFPPRPRDGTVLPARGALVPHGLQRFSGDRRAELEESPRALTPAQLLHEGAGVLWEMMIVLQIPPTTRGFPRVLSLP